jgi:formyl-CoA transferase
MGFPADPALATLTGRLAARDAVDTSVAAWTQRYEAADATERLQAAGVSAMPVLHGEDLRADPHLEWRGALVTLDDPDIGPTRHSGNSLRFGRLPRANALPAPRLGEHTAAVLGRWLGLDAAAIERLVEEGVCR